ncbi:GPP34 family phosphoprotein [Streptomyces sp. NPDC058653]|uniref:GOLPH3/VPS74 family protein n=1 Tax=Streptomyces sp. NPDC058653 TaxID=3346576 RepID=UPI003668D7A1
MSPTARTLPQQLYLLCYTVDKGTFELLNLQGRGQLLRAGALAEMTLDGLLGADGGKVERLTDTAPDDSFLAEVWQDLPTGKPKNWLQFVHNKAHTADRPVRDQLADTGALDVTRASLLGVLRTDRVTVTEPEQVRGLQERVRAAVLSGTDPSALPVKDVTLAVLAAETEVNTVLTAKEARAHRKRFHELAAHFDTAVPGLRKALRGSYLSSRAVGGGWSS